MPAAPDIAGIASLIGDRTRARLLTALMDGRSLTATELSRAAGVTKQTTSAHLSRLTSARLVALERQGRHRYFRLADQDIGTLLETLMGVASRIGRVQVIVNPVEPQLRKARVCYDHLAGDLGVLVFDSLLQRGFLLRTHESLGLSEAGEQFCLHLGIDLAVLRGSRRPLCRACLDWSARRHHLAGALGAALLAHYFARGWVRQSKGSRVLHFSAIGERALRGRFTLP